MTEYDQIPDHPLAGVSQHVLDCARAVLAEAAQNHDVDPELAEPLADSVIMALAQAGWLK